MGGWVLFAARDAVVLSVCPKNVEILGAQVGWLCLLVCSERGATSINAYSYSVCVNCICDRDDRERALAVD